MRPTVVHLLSGLGFGGNETLCLQLVRHAPPGVANVVIYQDPARTELLPLFATCPTCGSAAYRRGASATCRRVAAGERNAHASAGRRADLRVWPAPRARGARRVERRRSAMHAAAGNPASERRWAAQVALSSFGFSAVLGVPVHACSAAVERSFRELGGASARFRNHRQRLRRRRHRRAGRAGPPAAPARRPPRGRHGRPPRPDQGPGDPDPRVRRGREGAPAGGAVADRRRRGGRGSCAISPPPKAWPTASFSGGPRRDVPELLGQMDLFAFSTTCDEGFGIALIEAMAAGLPVVASDVPACREVLGDGAAGVLVPAGDPRPLRRRSAPCWARSGREPPWAAAPATRDRALRRRRLRRGLVRGPAERARSPMPETGAS